MDFGISTQDLITIYAALKNMQQEYEEKQNKESLTAEENYSLAEVSNRCNSALNKVQQIFNDNGLMEIWQTLEEKYAAEN